MSGLTSKALSTNASRKDTRVIPGYAFTVGITIGQTRYHFGDSIISVISEDWTGEEQERLLKSCCVISIDANAKFCGDTRMRR